MISSQKRWPLDHEAGHDNQNFVRTIRNVVQNEIIGVNVVVTLEILLGKCWS
jgi:hypothetical protein